MHRLLENYVRDAAQTASPLLNTEERTANEAELRQHLSELMRSHEELGLDADAAARAALVQFGQAKTVRRGLERASLRSLVRDRAFWQAAAAATATQMVLNAVGAKWVGWGEGKVTAIALVQLYSDHRLNFLFAVIWLAQLLVVGKITARLCPRGAPLAASLFGIYQAVAGIVTVAVNSNMVPPSSFYFWLLLLIFSTPPAIYALFAWGFVRRQSARQILRA